MDNMVSTPSGLIVPAHTIEQGSDRSAAEALDKHYSAIAKLEGHFPQLVLLAKRLANAVTQMVEEKGLGPEAVMFDTPRWHPSGKVYVRIGFDHEAERITTTDKAAKNFATLREINETVPQVVDLAMALASYLVTVINDKKMHAKDITIGKPVFGPQRDHFIFDMGMARPDFGIH